MKLTKRTLKHFLGLIFLGLIIGTLCWELLAKIVERAGADISLSVGPVGFDLDAISFFFKINPGSPLGALGGILLFRRIK